MSHEPQGWDGQERRAPVLSEEQVEQIAERAAAKAMTKLTGHVYQEIGKGVVSKAMWILGALATGLYLWAVSKGWIKLP